MNAAERVRVINLDSEMEPRDIPKDPTELLRLLGGPTLIRQQGLDTSRTRIVSTLLHANEPSGLVAVGRWLRSEQKPATNALFFIASVQAALYGNGFQYRFVPGERDMNRCWLPPFEHTESLIAQEALALMRQSGAECLVDLHNNTGHNPPYGVGPTPGNEELQMVSLWGERFIHSTLRLGTLVEATRDDFPSVTIECGRSFDPAADDVAHAGLVKLLEANKIGRGQPTPPIKVLTDPVRVNVRAGIALAFGEHPSQGAELTIALDIDRHNFEEMAQGTAIGWLEQGTAWPLEAFDEHGRDVSSYYFEIRDEKLVARRPLIPVMMTTNRDNALADCLFYIVR